MTVRTFSWIVLALLTVLAVVSGSPAGVVPLISYCLAFTVTTLIKRTY